ncbi:MAG: methyltransferase domain-containing protein [Alphaproteobacteria bacterium]|nr:methyltransferase domain-containing protein [Alphaproteobacteria bacterium]
MNSDRLPGLLVALALVASCGGKTDAPSGEAAAPAAIEDPSAPRGSLAWAAGGEWRIEKARDAHRHPVETLSFFGVRGSDTVVEISPGGGWYTAILGPYLREGGGRLYAAHLDPATSDYARANVEAFKAVFVDRPDVFGTIDLTIGSRESPGLAPDGSADVVLTFRNVHNWMAGGYADKIFADAYRALKPGGVLGIEEHRLPSARDQNPAAGTGYVQEAYVIQLAAAAGFRFDGASEINANKKDTTDHPLGVWMLPPTLRSSADGGPPPPGYDAETYRAIGESDRMTLRFVKPADSPPTP